MNFMDAMFIDSAVMSLRIGAAGAGIIPAITVGADGGGSPADNRIFMHARFIPIRS
jgi:hypothetical protein